MKRSTSRRGLVLFVGLVLFFAGAAGTVYAQAQPRLRGKEAVRTWLKELKITDEELKSISELVARDEPALAKAKADIRIHQANVARLLLESEPDRTAIAAELDKSLEAERTIRMVQIDRQIRLRSLLGEARWKLVLLLAREARVAEGAGKLRESFSKRGLSPQEAERWAKILLLLRSCL